VENSIFKSPAESSKILYPTSTNSCCAPPNYAPWINGLFAGSATLVGTGAFTAVQADRTATINIAGDSNALLQIEAYDNKSEQFVTTNGGAVAIDITNPGVNRDAIIIINQLLEVTNQGTEKVTVGFEAEYAVQEGDFSGDPEEVLPYGYTYATNDTADVGLVVWASPKESRMDNTYAEVRPELVTTGFAGSTLVDGRSMRDEIVNTIDGGGDGNGRKIDPGESVNIGIVITTRDRTINQNGGIPNALDDNITLVAKSTEDV
jgi:hypothetical protein